MLTINKDPYLITWHVTWNTTTQIPYFFQAQRTVCVNFPWVPQAPDFDMSTTVISVKIVDTTPSANVFVHEIYDQGDKTEDTDRLPSSWGDGVYGQQTCED